MTGRAELELTVNGVRQVLVADSADTLLDVLRRELSLFSCRETCGLGLCGSCTVLLEGRAVSSCLVLALTRPGARITTSEGLTEGGQLHPVQRAFVDSQAFQCSFCTPGFVLSVVALLGEQASGRSVDAALSGHLCRCGSYRRVRLAVDSLLAADANDEEEVVATEQFSREIAVATDPDGTWQVLTDVSRLAGWVGIVRDVVELSRLEKYTAVLEDRVGPFKLRADLEIAAQVVREGRHIELQASGRDRAVDSRISVSAKLVIAESGSGTTVAVDGTYQVTGRVASMGSGVIRKKADRILADFFGHAVAELGTV